MNILCVECILHGFDFETERALYSDIRTRVWFFSRSVNLAVERATNPLGASFRLREWPSKGAAWHGQVASQGHVLRLLRPLHFETDIGGGRKKVFALSRNLLFRLWRLARCEIEDTNVRVRNYASPSAMHICEKSSRTEEAFMHHPSYGSNLYALL